MVRWRYLFLLLAMTLTFNQHLWAAAAPKRAPSQAEKTLAEIMALQGNDRIKKLMEGARKEGTLVFYSPDREELTKIRFDLYNEIYPGVTQKLEAPRIRSDVMIDRILTEERAGKHQADVVWLRLPQVPILLREGVLAKYLSLEDSHLPQEFRIGSEWRSLGNRLFHITYNTKLVAEKDAPKTWDDLLNPKWKGKLILDDSSFDWFVGLIDYMGEQKGLDYMKKLAQNGLQTQTGRSNVENLVAAGEVPIMVADSGTSVSDRISKGEPLAYVKDPHPPIAYGEGLAIMGNAPHPYTAALFIEAVLTEKWQRGAAEKIGIRPARSGIPDPLLGPAIKPHFIIPAKWPPDRDEWAQREYVRLLVRKNF